MVSRMLPGIYFCLRKSGLAKPLAAARILLAHLPDGWRGLRLEQRVAAARLDLGGVGGGRPGLGLARGADLRFIGASERERIGFDGRRRLRQARARHRRRLAAEIGVAE